jgi:hypothetical protein
LCRSIRSNVGEAKKQAGAKSQFQVALRSGNWPKAKADLMTILDGSLIYAAQTIEPDLRSAPREVKAADATMTEVLDRVRRATEASRNPTQFESSVLPLEKQPRVLSAEHTLGKYFTQECGRSPAP